MRGELETNKHHVHRDRQAVRHEPQALPLAGAPSSVPAAEKTTREKKAAEEKAAAEPAAREKKAAEEKAIEDIIILIGMNGGT